MERRREAHTRGDLLHGHIGKGHHLFHPRWLMDRFGLGSWVLLIAVLLALASIVSAFTQFFHYMLRQAEEEERDYREGGL